MKKKKISAVLGIICLVVILAALPTMAACAKPAPTTREPYEIQIYTWRVGSSAYVLGVALADLINKHSTWLKATAIEAPGSTVNAKMLGLEPEKRKNTVVFSSLETQYKAGVGHIPGLEGKPYETLRQLALFNCANAALVTVKPNIKNIRDLEGKVVALGIKAIWGMSVLPQAAIEKAGIKVARYEYLPFTPAVAALKDGRIDAAYLAAMMIGLGKWGATPALEELIATADPYFISFEEAMGKTVVEMTGGSQWLITTPAGALGPKQPEPWTGIAAPITWAADIELPDDVAYEICRIMYENADKFAEYHITGRTIGEETMAFVGTDEGKVHPGALKFYKEKGMSIGRIK